MRNRRLLFDLLFAAASDAPRARPDKQRLGAPLGITAVLHTWTRDLAVPSPPPLHRHRRRPGARRRALDRDADEDYLFPVRSCRGLFRGKFLAASRGVRPRRARPRRRLRCALADPESSGRLQGPALSQGLGRLRQAALRRPRAGLPLPRPLHPSRRHLQPPTRRRSTTRASASAPRTARHVTLGAGGVHPPLPAPRPARPASSQDPPLRPARGGNVNAKLALARFALAAPGLVDHDSASAPADDPRESDWQIEIDLVRCPQCKLGMMVSRLLPSAGSRSPPLPLAS